MPTITLVQNTRANADHIHLMTAMPMNVDLTNLAGGPGQFTCTNALANIANANSVKITYDASVPGNPHEDIQVSSVIA